MRIILVTLLLVSCGQDPFSTKKEPAMDLNEFEPYVEMFLSEGAHQGRTIGVQGLRIKFGHTEWPVIGVCHTGGDAPRITIDFDFWQTANSVRRLTLMYHELGHCLLGRGHTDKFSIMQPFLLGASTMTSNEDELFEELFSTNYSLDGNDIPSDFCGGMH